MSTAEELFSTGEPHIVIGSDRKITVPDALKRIAVQYDHNVETVTFDCPRYLDDIDMSVMKIYINYMRPDGKLGQYFAINVVVDDTDDTIIHFDWTISRNVSEVKGNLSFLVCSKKVDDEGNEINHWNSELNRDLTVSEGLECGETILEAYPDVITQILTRLDSSSGTNDNNDMSLNITQVEFIPDATEADVGRVIQYVNSGTLSYPVSHDSSIPPKPNIGEIVFNCGDLAIGSVAYGATMSIAEVDAETEGIYYKRINTSYIEVWLPTAYEEGAEYYTANYDIPIYYWKPIQSQLVSGENVKTINGQSILGSGDITIEGGSTEIPQNVETTDNKVTEVTETSTDEQYPSAKAVAKAIAKAEGVQTLSSSNFVNGIFTDAGTGIVASDYWIITNPSIPVKVGDKITIKPNGFKVWWRIVDSDDLSVAAYLKNGGTTTEDVEYVSEYDGWVTIQLQKTNGTKITPLDYICNIQIGKTFSDKISENTKNIETLKTETKCVTKLKGKKIVNFGDSIFGKYRDTNEEDKSISTMISEQTGAICYNAGFGGCFMTRIDNAWDAFSMHSLADSVNSGSWQVQEDALTNGTGMPAYFSETVNMLKGIDWGTIDIITIAYGVNDYSNNKFIEDTDSTFVNEYDYYKGALRYSIRQILSAYPHIKIAIITPLWKWNRKDDGSFDYSSDDIEKSQNTRGYTLVDYVDACIDVSNEFHTICVDNYYNLSINKYNYLSYFNSNDGTHPNKNGRQLCADNITSKILTSNGEKNTNFEKFSNEIKLEVDEIHTEIDTERDRITELEGTRSLSSSDFVNGSFTAGTGIVASDYWIITNPSIPVKVGDKITIKPNGLKVWWRIQNSDDLSVAINLKNGGVTTENVEYISEYDGWVTIQLQKTNGTKTTPTDYVCNIAIGEPLKSRIDNIESDVTDLKEDVEKLKDGNTSNTTISISPKTKPFTNIINDCQTASDWTITNNDTTLVSADTTNFILGSQSLRCDKQMICNKHTYDLLNNDLVVKLRINSIAQGATLDLRIGYKTGGSLLVYTLAKGSEWTTSSDWQEMVIPYTAYTYGNTELDFSIIDNIIIMSTNGDVDWNLQYIGLRPKMLKKGIVTFTFDDGYKSQYTGIKLLAEKGITGTIFHIKEATDKASAQALTITELQELVNYYGADIEVHGDPSYDQWEEAELMEHWINSQKWLKENGLGEGKHLAYPNNKFPDNIVQLAKGYFESCRTCTPFIPLETYPPADRYRLRAVSGVGAYNVTVDKVKQYIDRANETGAWLVLVFHKIGDGTDSMWCSEADLKAIADYAISSGAYIMNYAEVFDSVITAD